MVRAMAASAFSSTIWLIAAADALLRAIPRLPKIRAFHGTSAGGAASTMPTSAVKTSSATTLGLHSS